jgi:hypothetical protein
MTSENKLPEHCSIITNSLHDLHEINVCNTNYVMLTEFGMDIMPTKAIQYP